MVRNNVRRVAPNATVTFTRASYANFTDVGQAEDFGDVNSNGACDNGETFEDANANGVWDANRGQNGNGGARDAVLYGVSVSYKRLFPIGRLIGQSDNMVLNTTTILRNQPYGLQQGAPATGTCP